MKRNLAVSLLAIMLATASTMPALNAESGEISTSFTIEDNYLGSEVEVILPDSMPLSYNPDTNSLENTSKVGVKGTLADSQAVNIVVDKEIKYRNTSNPNIEVLGSVLFGVQSEDDATKLIETWTKDEIDNEVEKDISISVDRDSVTESGDYISSIHYTAEIVSLDTESEPANPSAEDESVIVQDNSSVESDEVVAEDNENQ